MKFTKAEQKQIEGRFGAMYSLLTKKTWIQGREARDKAGEPVDPTDKTAKAFCLIGAVRHINGPTEEQIKALTALQILLDTNALDNLIENVSELDCYTAGKTGDQSVDRLLVITDIVIALEDDDHEYWKAYGEDANEIIVNWNDDGDREHKEVRAMLRRAQGLYAKVYAAHLVDVQYGLMVKKLTLAAKSIKI